MKNCKGFSLLEVIISLSIITTMLATIFPFIITIYSERVTIRQTYDALDILQNNIQEYLFDGREFHTQKVDQNGTTYLLQVNMKTSNGMEEYSACVSWVGRNERFYERCETAKK